jgi:CheY-like chemotaxis protein
MLSAATVEQDVDVLLVEDHEGDAELLLRALKRGGFANKVHWLKDGEEALDLLFGRGPFAGIPAKDRARLVLLDLRLPKRDGFDVLRALKQDERTRSLPVLVMSSSDEPRDRERAFALGASRYLLKPIGFEEFSAAAAELGLQWRLVRGDRP